MALPLGKKATNGIVWVVVWHSKTKKNVTTMPKIRRRIKQMAISVYVESRKKGNAYCIDFGNEEPIASIRGLSIGQLRKLKREIEEWTKGDD